MEETELTPKLEEKPSKRVAVIQVSISLLETILPMESKILGVRENPETKTFDFTVSHPSFKELTDGDTLPLQKLLVYKDTHLSRTEYAS